ncbi:MAG: DMT family transporter [Candidatus Thermoplasmatota archaeon]|nr:DMT family transporter [Candidatus Thermoplasmatota archaeon]
MKNKALLTLFISVLSASSAAIIIVSCDESTSKLTIAFYRLFFTTLLITPIVLFNKNIREEIKKIERSTFILLFLIGGILATHFAFWITSLEFTSVASSVILVTAHPILVGPVSHFLLKEKLTIFNLVGIMISITGVIILVYGNYDISGNIDTFGGNILAILGGIAAGFYIIGGRKIRKNVSVFSYAFIVYAIGTIFLFFICLFFNAPLYGIGTKDMGLIFLMALIAGIFGHTLYNWSLEYVRASIASVFLLGEPFFSTIFAFLIPWIHQIPSEFTILGGSIIFLGIYLTTRNNENT